MKLANEEIENVFEINNDTVNVLVVEDEKLFTKYCLDINSLINGENGNFVLSENEEMLQFSKYSFIINDYFTISLNDKKFITKLYQTLQQITDEKFLLEFAKIRQMLFSLLDKLNAESEVPLEYDENVEFNSFVKACGVKVEEKDKTILEKIVSLFAVFSMFSQVKCVFFIGLKNFLSSEELALLYKEAKQKGLSLFLLENVYKQKLEFENVLIIDRDLCEISG